MADRREGPLALYSTSESVGRKFVAFVDHRRSADAQPRQLDPQKTKTKTQTAMATAAELRAAIEAQGVPLITPDELDAQPNPQEAWRRVRMAAVWKQPKGLLERCGPGLRLVMSLGAGVDFLLGSPAVVAPDGQVVVPETPSLLPQRRASNDDDANDANHQPLLVARIVDPHMASRMAAWVAWGVLTWQRRMLDYAECQRKSEWAGTSVERGHNRDARDVRVGVLGYGVMGRATAALLARMGYRVSAWARRGRRRSNVEEEGGEPGIEGLEDWGGEGGEAAAGRIRVRWPDAGDDARLQLQAFAQGQDVLVVLLPLTPATVRCVDADLLARLRPNGCLINGARGAHVDAPAALAALDGGQLGLALLDVFDVEPLPKESPLWRHPRLVITPHAAAFTELSAAAKQVGRCWRATVEAAAEGVEGGDEGGGGGLARLLGANLVDREAGY
jgi:glyoxylate/hydroxypyruvate reductase A